MLLGIAKAARDAIAARCRLKTASGTSTLARLAAAENTVGRRLTTRPKKADSRTSGVTRGWRNAANRANADARSSEPAALLDQRPVKSRAAAARPRSQARRWPRPRRRSASAWHDCSFEAMTERDFDLVLYGATGFVGKLTAEYLARAGADARIALAGRSTHRLREGSD